LRLFSFGGYGLALAVLAVVVFGAYDSYPLGFSFLFKRVLYSICYWLFLFAALTNRLRYSPDKWDIKNSFFNNQ